MSEENNGSLKLIWTATGTTDSIYINENEVQDFLRIAQSLTSHARDSKIANIQQQQNEIDSQVRPFDVPMAPSKIKKELKNALVDRLTEQEWTQEEIASYLMEQGYRGGYSIKTVSRIQNRKD